MDGWWSGWDIYCLFIPLGIQQETVATSVVPPTHPHPTPPQSHERRSTKTNQCLAKYRSAIGQATQLHFIAVIILPSPNPPSASQPTHEHVGLPNFTAFRVHTRCGHVAAWRPASNVYPDKAKLFHVSNDN